MSMLIYCRFYAQCYHTIVSVQKGHEDPAQGHGHHTEGHGRAVPADSDVNPRKASTETDWCCVLHRMVHLYISICCCISV